MRIGRFRVVLSDGVETKTRFVNCASETEAGAIAESVSGNGRLSAVSVSEVRPGEYPKRDEA